MSDTVTVPRWALEYVLDAAVPPRLWTPLAKLEKWAGATVALRRAFDAKPEPDQPGHPPWDEESRRFDDAARFRIGDDRVD